MLVLALGWLATASPGSAQRTETAVDLFRAKSLRCEFREGTTATWHRGMVRLERGAPGDGVTSTFDSIDLKRQRAKVVLRGARPQGEPPSPGPDPSLALSLGPDRGLDDALTTVHGPSTRPGKGLPVPRVFRLQPVGHTPASGPRDRGTSQPTTRRRERRTRAGVAAAPVIGPVAPPAASRLRLGMPRDVETSLPPSSSPPWSARSCRRMCLRAHGSRVARLLVRPGAPCRSHARPRLRRAAHAVTVPLVSGVPPRRGNPRPR
jgi:hypothetical protein